MTIAVVLNPRARALRRDAGLRDRLAAAVGADGAVSVPEGREALRAWADGVVASGCRRVAICGGDGTVHQVLTALDAARAGAPSPEVMLLHGGTMNTVSRSMGQRGRPVEQLAAWVSEVRGGAPLARTPRWPLRVDGRHTGFLFGIGIVPRFIEAYESGPEPSPAMAAFTLARAVASAFTGGAFAERFFRGIPAEVVCDDVAWPRRSWRILTAGAVHVIGLDFVPFPGVLQHPGHMHVFGSASSPGAFARDLIPLRLGRPARHPLAHDQVCRRMVIRAEEPLTYNLDGDLYTVGTSVEVVAGDEVRFVLAPGARQPPHRLT